MLIGTSFAFLLLCLPAEINDLFNYIGQERSCSHWFRKVILMLMQQIYFAGHFYIYILTSQLFRKHLCEILFSYRRRNSINNQQTLPFGVTDQRSSMKTENSQYKTTAFHASVRTSHTQVNDKSFLTDTSTRLLSVSK